MISPFDASCALVDWGTSSFRLWLVDAAGAVLSERRSQEGMAAAAKIGFASVLQAHLDALGAPERLPVVICGMAGARQGWIEAGYVDTPAPIAAIPAGASRVPGLGRDVRILPGVAQRVPSAPDVMRGEETQLLGVFADGPKDDALACMPGTHSKWVRLSGRRVESFSTFMTGELFDAVSRHTILSHSVSGADREMDRDAFVAAVRDACDRPARVANLLFQVRAGDLLFGSRPASARERVSGALIGLELAGGLADRPPAATVTLIASGRLSALYQLALDAVSVAHRAIDADAAALRGLGIAARAFWSEGGVPQ